MRPTVKTRSLVRHVVSIVLLAQILCAAVLSTVALMQERHVRLRALDVRLRGRSDSLLGAIQDAEDPADNVTIDPAELKLPADDLYAVYNQDGRRIGPFDARLAELLQPRRSGIREERLHGKSYRVYQRDALRIIDRAEHAGIGLRRPVTIVYASPEGPLWHEIFEATGSYLLTILVVVVATAVVVVLLLRRALVPLVDLASAAGRLSAPALVFVPPPSVLGVQELRPLAEVLTHVVDRLREAFAKEQRFIGDAAHELKTAVAVVRSTVQVLMLRHRSPEEHVAGLRRILEDTNRVELLVAQMLSSAAVEASAPATTAPLDLQQSVTEVLQQLGSIAEAHGVTLAYGDRSPAKVRLLPQQASVLVSNLVLNAIQHSPAGSSVHVSTRQEGGGTVVLTVADRGSGIGPEALPHVFERFYREDASRSRETGGAGLGLAISKSIVEAVAGTIQINSTPGKGTSVTATFIEN